MHKILIVEDDDKQRELYNDYYIECGYQTLLAENIENGLQKLQKHHPELVLLDMCLPDATGLEFLEKMKKNKDETPVCVITGKPGLKNSPEFHFYKQVQEVFVKPIHLIDLKNITKILARTQNTQPDIPSIKNHLIQDEKKLMGSLFADCYVEEYVGRGVSGLVYKGRHLGLGIPVAIKVLDPILARSSQEKRRFLREIEILTRLEHKNLVKILNAGVKEDLYFMVMRYIEGVTLEAKLKKGKLDWLAAAKIIIQCASALQASHEMELIHRDVKPSNIMITNIEQQVVIIDFGLARTNNQQSITQKNMIVGTPYYMSPEQCLNLPLNHQTDIYSLGATFYHLIVGRPPFCENNAVDTMIAHTTKKVVSPSRIDNNIPIELSQIIIKMLQKTIHHRYADMNMVSSDLELFLQKYKTD